MSACEGEALPARELTDYERRVLDAWSDTHKKSALALFSPPGPFTPRKLVERDPGLHRDRHQRAPGRRRAEPAPRPAASRGREPHHAHHASGTGDGREAQSLRVDPVRRADACRSPAGSPLVRRQSDLPRSGGCSGWTATNCPLGPRTSPGPCRPVVSFAWARAPAGGSSRPHWCCSSSSSLSRTRSAAASS